MKLKEIKPGMAIKCSSFEEALLLYGWFYQNGYVRKEVGEDLFENFIDCWRTAPYGIEIKPRTWTTMDGAKEITPFSSLIIEEKTYEDGLNEAWECAKKIVLRKEHGGLSCEDLDRIFEREPEWEVEYSVFKNLTPQEVIAKLEAYEAEKQIKVGNVVKHIRESNVKILVTAVYEDSFDGIKVGQSDECGKLGSCYSGSSFGMYKRTGTNIDISSILAEIGKE